MVMSMGHLRTALFLTVWHVQQSAAQECANLDTLNDLVNVTCPNDCSGHGVCDGATAICACADGWGSATDIAEYKAPDCSLRVCANGLSWVTNAVQRNFTDRPLVECSARGICNREDGRCMCASGYSGVACGLRKCVGGCNGRGQCVSMSSMAALESEDPLDTQFNYVADNSSSWDAEMIYGCVCESPSWSVGLGDEQYQVLSLIHI